MKSDIEILYQFQKQYLINVLENIPKEQAYEKQLEGFNSAGWIMGHICVEGLDVLEKLKRPIKQYESWKSFFSYDAPKLSSVEACPSIAEEVVAFKEIYDQVLKQYLKLDEEEKQKRPQSELLGRYCPNQSSWIAHHLTTHISIHIGNIVVWKKMLGIPIQGY